MDEQKLEETTAIAVAVPTTLDEDSNVAVLTKELQLVDPESIEGGALHKFFTTSEEILEAEAKDNAEAMATTERLIGEMTVPMTDDDLHENFHLRRCPKEHGIQRNVPEWDHEDAEAIEIEGGVEAEEDGSNSDADEAADVELSVLPGSSSRISAETSQKTRSLRQTLRDTLRFSKKTKKLINEEVENPDTDSAEEASASVQKKSWFRRVFSRTRK